MYIKKFTCVAANSGLLYATSGLLIVGCVSIYMYIHTVPVEAGDTHFARDPWDSRSIRVCCAAVA